MTSLAWRNVVHDSRRTLAAVSGVAFAILLVFMQLGFYSGCKTSATLIYDSLDFDAVLVSNAYVHLRLAHDFPLARLNQAGGAPGVERAVPVYVTAALWRNIESRVTREILVLGVNPDDHPFTREEMNACLPLLKNRDTVVIDQVAKPLIGPHPVGTVTELNGRRIEVVADYRCGTGLIADGSLLTSDLTFSRLCGNSSLGQVQLGLLRFAPDADREQVLRGLRAQCPGDTQVLSRDEMNAREQHFFLRVKPIGFLFTSGLYVGLLVGAVILYQVLSADIAKHLRQYATLKAMGYGPGYLYRVVMTQGILFGVLAYCPALVLSAGIYVLVRKLTDLPMYLTLEKMTMVFALSVAMCMAAGGLAVRKVNSADPADLF